ncbi:Abi-like protein [Fusobacterium gonidiaformans 3-1-5R]|uniref:Abi-like protein n=2 Tax=Fusobacterium TaxID=848 RepID=E5BF57_9FUSO|nr:MULTISPECIES: Abi family protein [Fusobacterium]EFS20738.1 Abi-like protein [Fusobacterium gonidiaformans 3-1-5R]KXA12727.1 Abi-like protein [Fusobacterium equinum]
MANKNKPNKPFKTYRQQLKVLRNRNLTISNGSHAISILKRDNYYNIINGYKEIFLEVKGQNEKFYTGTTFEHINALYVFDKKIRHLFLYYILIFENLIKTKIAYYHTETFDEIFNYLDVNNFSGKAESITKLIASISKEIEKYTGLKQPNAFSHYIEEHGELPLWVLFQKATFGTASYFFSSLQNNIKDKICTELNEEHNNRYGLKSSIFINPIFLENTIHFINSYRNVCAHNERFYNSTFQKRGFKVDYSHYTKTEFRGTIFDLLIILKLFLLKSDFEILKKDFKKQLNKLENELVNNPNALEKIKRSALKLPIGWENILNHIWK